MFRTLAASISLRSKLNLAMAKASKDRNLVADPDVEMVLDPAAACLECKVCDVSVKLWSAIRTVEKRQED